MPLEIGDTPNEGAQEEQNPTTDIQNTGTVETVDPSTLQKDTPAYVAYYAAKSKGEDPDAAVAALQNSNGVSKVDAMPEGGHAKFYDPKSGEYDWQSHAKEVEFNAKGRKNDEEEGKDDDAITSVIEAAGLTIDDLRSQIVTNKDIDEPSKEALIQQGIPRELIDDYVALGKAHFERQEEDATEYAGGSDELQAMSIWASQNLNDNQKSSINNLLQSENWKDGIDLLKQKYSAATGGQNREGDLVDGEGGAGSLSGYQDRDQMYRDMRDPKYQTSEAFRQQVAVKVQNASWKKAS